MFISIINVHMCLMNNNMLKKENKDFYLKTCFCLTVIEALNAMDLSG